MESSGQCEWELVSAVDNTQRGSEKRMVEKMKYTIENKLQPKSESEMTRMERQELEAERDRARAEKQAAEDRVREMEGERDRAREEKGAADYGVRVMESRMREMEGERDRAREEKGAAEYRVREMEDIITQMEGAMQGERDRVREMEGERNGVRKELQQALARATELERRLNEVEGREHEKLVVQEQAIAAEQRGPSWEVGEDELEVMDEQLGCGAWAKVKVAKLKVAAKILHDELIYDYHRRLFRREMDVAARVSHPNLLRFLGARLEGGMAILTEIMPTSLRALVNRRPRQLLSLQHILSITMDVACALNYLHHMTPDPMVHRDLSSANVLLHATHSRWRLAGQGL